MRRVKRHGLYPTEVLSKSSILILMDTRTLDRCKRTDDPLHRVDLCSASTPSSHSVKRLAAIYSLTTVYSSRPAMHFTAVCIYSEQGLFICFMHDILDRVQYSIAAPDCRSPRPDWSINKSYIFFSLKWLKKNSYLESLCEEYKETSQL